MSLNHAANWTRVDLALLVSKCAKYMQEPGEVHVNHLKKGLRYLRGKTDIGLVYDFSQAPVRSGLYGFFDASHADDRHSEVYDSLCLLLLWMCPILENETSYVRYHFQPL